MHCTESYAFFSFVDLVALFYTVLCALYHSTCKAIALVLVHMFIFTIAMKHGSDDTYLYIVIPPKIAHLILYPSA